MLTPNNLMINVISTLDPLFVWFAVLSGKRKAVCKDHHTQTNILVRGPAVAPCFWTELTGVWPPPGGSIYLDVKFISRTGWR